MKFKNFWNFLFGCVGLLLALYSFFLLIRLFVVETHLTDSEIDTLAVLILLNVAAVIFNVLLQQIISNQPDPFENETEQELKEHIKTIKAFYSILHTKYPCLGTAITRNKAGWALAKAQNKLRSLQNKKTP